MSEASRWVDSFFTELCDAATVAWRHETRGVHGGLCGGDGGRGRVAGAGARAEVASRVGGCDGKPQFGPDSWQSAGAVSESVGASLPGRDSLLCTDASQLAQLPGDDLWLDTGLHQRRLQARIWRADADSPADPARSWLAGVLRGPPPARLHRRRPRKLRPPP